MPEKADGASSRAASVVLEVCDGLDESMFHRVEGWEALAVAQTLAQQIDEERRASGSAEFWFENELEEDAPDIDAQAVAAAAKSYRAARVAMSGKSPGADVRMREEVVSDRAADRIAYYGAMLATAKGIAFTPTVDRARAFMERAHMSAGRPLGDLDEQTLRDAAHAAGPVQRAADKVTSATVPVEAPRVNAFEKGSTMDENTATTQETTEQATPARDFTIKEPNAPASDAQIAFLNDLLQAGVVSADEMSRLGSDPTKQAASDLIGAHSESEAFKAVQQARRERAAAARAEAKAAKEAAKAPEVKGKSNYANVKMPAAFLTQHTFTAKDGREFDKAYVKLPAGVKVNGVDLGGFSCDVFLNERMKQQMLAGEQVTLSFKTSEPVAVWTGKKGDEQYPYQRYEVDAWDLVKGIKAEREEFAAGKAAEREAEKAPEEPDGIGVLESEAAGVAEAQYEGTKQMGGEAR